MNFNDMINKVIQGDCLEVMKDIPDNSIDSIVTDPPYGISFMGKKWDYDVPKVEVWKEALRILKPGGHILVACGTRTQHRMAVNIEDAGFEVRDIVSWVYGSGFPKSLNISKSIDKMNGIKPIGREEPSGGITGGKGDYNSINNRLIMPETQTQEAKQWEGWGTALKPAMELFTLARKPISESNIAQNVLKHGTGGINIDGCRVDTKGEGVLRNHNDFSNQHGNKFGNGMPIKTESSEITTQGRFPANLIHDGSEEVLEGFPESNSLGGTKPVGGNYKLSENKTNQNYFNFGDTGSASRFFYCAKASKSERNKGLEDFDEEKVNDGREIEADNAYQRGKTLRANTHPTVKPIKLMRYLAKLITPKNGIVLDPYIGSGTTGIACKLEGFNFIGIEREEDYVKIAESRIKAYYKKTDLEVFTNGSK